MEVSLEGLERRLRALEDINAIKDLKARYWRACDRQKPEDVRACFAPAKAVVDYEGFPLLEERDAFVALYSKLGCRPGVMDMHHGQNPIITMTGPDSATGLWDIFYFGIDLEARTTVQLAGEYQDVYAKIDGQWLIQKTRFRQTSFLMQAIDKDGQSKCLSLGTQSAAAFGQSEMEAVR